MEPVLRNNPATALRTARGGGRRASVAGGVDRVAEHVDT